MRTLLLLAALSGAAFAAAQNDTSGSPAGASSTVRMSDATLGQAMAAMKTGKKVTITVDNRSVSFVPKTIGTMVYVPVLFFQETGQKVVWDRRDMRATVSSENGPQKNSVEYDAKRGRGANKPGPTMKPVVQKGTLYVPLASGLASFNLLAEWVPTSNRINVRTNRTAR